MGAGSSTFPQTGVIFFLSSTWIAINLKIVEKGMRQKFKNLGDFAKEPSKYVYENFDLHDNKQMYSVAFPGVEKPLVCLAGNHLVNLMENDEKHVQRNDCLGITQDILAGGNKNICIILDGEKHLGRKAVWVKSIMTDNNFDVLLPNIDAIIRKNFDVWSDLSENISFKKDLISISGDYINKTGKNNNDDQLMEITQTLAIEIIFKIIAGFHPKNVDVNIHNLKKEIDGFLAGSEALPIKIIGTEYYGALRTRDKLLKEYREIFQMYKSNDPSIQDRKNTIAYFMCKGFTEAPVEHQIDVSVMAEEMGSSVIAASTLAGRIIATIIHIIQTHPDLAKKLKEEIEVTVKVPHDRAPNMNEIHKMPYLDSFFSEIMRRFPFSGPLGIVGRTVADWDVPLQPDSEYNVNPSNSLTNSSKTRALIPKDSWVLCSMIQTHRDSEIYPAPFEFDPERFMPGKEQYKKAKHPLCAFMPHGGGDWNKTHRCGGEPLIRLIMKTFIVRYIQDSAEFDFLSSADSDLPIRLEDNRTGSPEGFLAILEKIHFTNFTCWGATPSSQPAARLVASPALEVVLSKYNSSSKSVKQQPQTIQKLFSDVYDAVYEEISDVNGKPNKDDVIKAWTNEFVGGDGVMDEKEFKDFATLAEVLNKKESSQQDPLYRPWLHVPSKYLDLHSRALLLTALSLNNKVRPSARDIKLPQPPRTLKYTTLFGLQISTEDDEVPVLQDIQVKSSKIANALLPNPDHTHHWKDHKEALDVIQKYFSPVLPKKNVEWNDLTGDEATVRFAFQGLGSEFLEPVTPSMLEELNKKFPDAGILNNNNLKPEFAIRMSFMSAFSVDKGLETHGADAYFTGFQNNNNNSDENNESKNLPILLFIIRNGEICKRPTSGFELSNDSLVQHWEYLKFSFRSAVAVYGTVVSHALYVHLLISNNTSMASRETLPANHPLRLLLHIFTIGTGAIDYELTVTLLAKGGVIARRGLTEKGLADMIADGVKKFTISSYPDAIRQRGMAGLPLPMIRDGTAMWIAFTDFVNKFFKASFKLNDKDGDKKCNDAAILLFWNNLTKRVGANVLSKIVKQVTAPTWNEVMFYVTFFMFSVTCQHGHVGQMAEYADPFCYGWAIQTDKIANAPPQSLGQMMTVVISTAVLMPKLLDKNWDHIFLDNNQVEGAKLFSDFQNNLIAISNQMKQEKKNGLDWVRNQWDFQNFNAFNLNSSVSV